MAVNINFRDYKSSGVYFIEKDNSIIDSVDTTSNVLVVGMSKQGPFNAPVYLESISDMTDVYGKIDTKLERYGVFFNRSLQTLLGSTSVYALNLMPISDGKDENVEGVALGLIPAQENFDASLKYIDLYDKSRFWKLSTDYLTNAINEDSDTKYPISFANVGTKDYTLIVRKAENLNGFNTTVRDWYADEADGKPYEWMRDMDYISDYFLQVICIKGNWDDISLAYDLFWKTYFVADSENKKAVLRKEKLTAFLKLDQVSVIGNYTGCIVPNFIDKSGISHDLKKMINAKTTTTGLLCAIDEELLESANIDFVGHTVLDDVDSESTAKCQFMSYDFSYDDIVTVEVSDKMDIDENKLYFESSDDKAKLANLTVGSLVLVKKDCLSKVLRRQILRADDDSFIDPSTGEVDPSIGNYAVITFGDAVDVDFIKEKAGFVVMPTIQSEYSTLKPIFLTGYNIDKKIDSIFSETYFSDVNTDTLCYGEDAPIGEIYSMLEQEGISRALKNKDLIDFRYVVDTMSHGLGDELGSKKYLSRLAKSTETGSTAVINAPSITEFTNTSLASYYDEDDKYKTFKSEYVPLGGNDSLPRSVVFSLPTEENGSKYCGVFSPFLQYTTGGRTILVPPAADVTVALLRKFNGGDPYVTTANRNGILKNGKITGVEYQFDRQDQDEFEPFGINPILYRNSQAIIYGDRTAYQDVISDFNYLHVRELLNTIEIECNAVLQDYVFRYNNAATRADVVQRITPILQGMQENGALYKFEIQMDENNNTDEVIDRSFALIDIGVWITKNMEKIVTTIKVNKLSE